MSESLNNNVVLNYGEIMEEYFENVVPIDWLGHTVSVSRTIPMDDMRGFVQSTIDACFSDDSVYHPEAKEFAFRVNLISRYSNIEPPEDLMELYMFLYRTNIVSVILSVADQNQISDIRDAIECGLRYRISMEVDSTRQALSKVAFSFEELGQNAEKIFNNIDPDSFKKMVDAFSEIGHPGDGKIIQAVLENQKKKQPNRRTRRTAK